MPNSKSLPIIDLRKQPSALFHPFLPAFFPFYSADLRISYWKIIAFFAPPLGATLIMGSLVKDNHHHWYDCVVGGIIGAIIGYAHFRTTYVSVWDYRFNHIPLSREGFHISEDELPFVHDFEHL